MSHTGQGGEHCVLAHKMSATVGQETSCTKQIMFKRPYKGDRWDYKIFGAPFADSVDLKNMCECPMGGSNSIGCILTFLPLLSQD